MAIRDHFLLPLLFAGAAAAATPSAVTVTFVAPEKYTDVGAYRNDNVPGTLKDIERYLQGLGAQFLPPGQKLAIEILDIDLAGDEHGRTGPDVRQQRGTTDPPTIRLRYTLERDGKREPAKEETLRDLNYQKRPIRSSEPLTYEKRMLDDWFRARFRQR